MAKKPSKRAWSVAHVLPAAARVAVVRPAAALGVAARAVGQPAAMAVVRVAVVAKVGEAGAKSDARCTKNAWSFEGNPSKRLKYKASHIAVKKFQSQSIQGKSK
jgi:hypothetical protein